jgi:uncharacterized protein YdcH (DUF465 family)
MKRFTLNELETQHNLIDREIKRLERRGFHLTPPEQLRATVLKKERLRAKDRLSELRRST